ncbi:MAG: 4-hydroxy-3-methylbut-2-enyl diphosphate reductase [Planctomycetia bacterium]|nr:4-hydroxy-3-methylbut-2-enyl diphosphate reductase [Planctomycetia bacterium]
MEIVLARPRGFCAGVKRAVAILEEILLAASRPDSGIKLPVYVFHELVHNTWVVRSFQNRGVQFVNDLDHVPAGSVLLFSAHGVAPIIRQQANDLQLKTVDATCPLVARIHDQVRNYAKSNYKILLIGHSGHDEVVGTIGEAPDRIYLIGSEKDAEDLVLAEDHKLACVMQTTLSAGESDRIFRKLCSRFPQLRKQDPPCICRATQEHQDAVRQCIIGCDAVLVVGSVNSSNTQRLAELAREFVPNSFLVDGPDEVRPEWLENSKRVLITSGASVPEEIVQKTVDRLVREWGAVVLEREDTTQDPTNPIRK